MRVKIFYGYPPDTEHPINEWLRENPKIVPKKLDGAERTSNSAIYIWYETRRTLPEKIMNIKLFYGYPIEHEKAINAWLTDNPKVMIKDSVAMNRLNDVAIFILYTAPR